MPKPAVALLLFALALVVLALVLWPRTGLLARFARRMPRSDSVLGEDVLKAVLHGRIRVAGDAASALGVARARAQGVVERLVGDGLLVLRDAGALALTAAGRDRAVHLVRAHRLWERYLADRTGLAEDEWHEAAERQEHLLSPEEVQRLAERMGSPLLDPHGDPIPSAGRIVPELEGESLVEAPAGTGLEIVHLEDEPADSYRRLVAEGLAPGQRLVVLEAAGAKVRLSLEGRLVELDAADADAVTVRESGPVPRRRARTLESLEPGESARVATLVPTLHGPQRRRLLDLGFVPGTLVVAEMKSALGDPMAYRVRGALVALRREQAASVEVEAA